MWTCDRCGQSAFDCYGHECPKPAPRKRPLCTRCDGDGTGPSWREMNCSRCGGSGKEPENDKRK